MTFTYTAIIYYRLPKKLDGNMYIYGGGVTRCCYFSYVFFSFKKITKDEVEDSSEIEMSIVNKSTPLIHEILFFFFFIVIRTTIRYAIRAHIHTHVCVCLGFLYFRFAIPVYKPFISFLLFVCVEGTLHCYLHLNNVTSKI